MSFRRRGIWFVLEGEVCVYDIIGLPDDSEAVDLELERRRARCGEEREKE